MRTDKEAFGVFPLAQQAHEDFIAVSSAKNMMSSSCVAPPIQNPSPGSTAEFEINKLCS